MTPLALALFVFAAPPAEGGDAAEPTLSISADIHADSLKVTQRGETKVRIWADPGGEGRWKLDRHGIPGPIPVGKTFRDVTLTLDARATIADGVALDADASGKAGN